MELLLPLSWAVLLGTGATAGGGGNPMRRGPHHPREAPLPPGQRHHKPTEKLTSDTNLIHDTAHLQEDLGRPLEDMSDEELEFHYFKLHDFDNNTLLDGLEMLKAIYHTMDHDHEDMPDDDHSDGSHEDHHVSSAPSDEDMKRFIELIDKVLEEDDTDRDGFISYPEFAIGRANGKSLNLSPPSVVEVK